MTCEPQPTSSFSPILVQIDRNFTWGLGGGGKTKKMGLPHDLVPKTTYCSSHSLQLQVEGAKFLVGMAESSGVTLLHPPAPVHGIETTLCRKGWEYLGQYCPHPGLFKGQRTYDGRRMLGRPETIYKPTLQMVVQRFVGEKAICREKQLCSSSQRNRFHSKQSVQG